MKLLFCCHTAVTKELGTPKGWIELSAYLRPLGWQCDVRGRGEILRFAQEQGVNLEHDEPEFAARTAGLNARAAARMRAHETFKRALHHYLLHQAPDYDVVEFDHEYQPCPRAQFCATTLMVARSFLLRQHSETHPVPPPRALKSRLKARLERASNHRVADYIMDLATRTAREADLINVNNTDAKEELIARGIAPEKIVVFGYAIDAKRRAAFDALSPQPPAVPTVAFVGSFDYRKGAGDFAALVKNVVARVPHARFKLLGTAGMFATEAQVRDFFPRALQGNLEIVPRFAAESLPQLLSDCSVGVFPSYREGFGFGVLEMLAACLPVVAYNAPGPPMMLPPEYLVPIGDTRAMSAKVVELLTDAEKLSAARAWANARSRDFTWDEIARGTDAVYRHHLQQLRARNGERAALVNPI